MNDWYADANIFLTLVVAIMTSVSAYATFRTWRLSRLQATEASPSIDDSRNPSIMGRSIDNGSQLIFTLDRHCEGEWRIKSVTCWPLWRSLMCGYDQQPDGAGGWIRGPTKKWVRWFAYEFPVERVEIFLHPEAPKVVWLEFTMCLRVAPQITSRHLIKKKVVP